MESTSRDEVIPEIMAEFSQIFAAAKTRWAKNAEAVHPELGGPGMMILQTILRRGPVTATGLSGMLHMDKALISRHLTKLRALGLVHAEEAESDRRVTLLTASAEAERTVDELKRRSAEDYRARFGGWSLEEVAQFRALLHRFNAADEDPRHDGPAKRCARAATGSAGTGLGDPKAYSPE